MTFRAMTLGFLLGLFISSYTFFNDHVARQGEFIANFLPVAVFGLIIVLVLVGNPLLSRISRRATFNASELAVSAAIALAVCGFPGSNFLRYLVPVLSEPVELQRSQYHSSWHADGVYFYAPGSMPYLATGQLRDWPGLIERVAEAMNADSPSATDDQAATQRTLRGLYELATEGDRAVWTVAFGGEVDTSRLRQAVNHVLANPAFADLPTKTPEHEVVDRSRQRLQEAIGDILTPPPAGDHAMLIGGRSDPDITDPLATGGNPDIPLPWTDLVERLSAVAKAAGGNPYIPLPWTPLREQQADDYEPAPEVPWQAWRGPIVVWVGAVLLLSLASLCLALVLHPQWAHRELLQYPIARVVTEMGARTGTSALPDIARSPLFWVAFVLPVVVHLFNGLQRFEAFAMVPEIPMRLDFRGLRQLFPNASRTALSGASFHPLILPSIVAFAFLLNRSVSFSLGIANYAFMFVGALFVANGMEMEYNKFTPNKNNLIRFGAYMGLAVMIAYSGRAYYWHVIKSTMFLGRYSDTPIISTWAARLCALFLIGAAFLLTTTGMSWWLSIVLIGMCLLVWVVIARVVAETGMVLMAGPFLPLGVLPALLGPEALGPTQLILLGVSGFLLLGDPKEAVLPFIMHGLQMGDRTGVRPRRIVWPLVVMMVLGLGVATFVTISLQYRFGVDKFDNHAIHNAPVSGFNEAVRVVEEMKARGTLEQTIAMSPTEQLAMIRAQPATLGWVILGGGLVILTGWLMLRVPWWPIHPVLFIVWGVWGIAQIGFSILLGWLASMLVTRLGGMRARRAVLPAVFGLIAGELVIALVWVIVGAIYFQYTGQTPPGFRIFP